MAVGFTKALRYEGFHTAIPEGLYAQRPSWVAESCWEASKRGEFCTCCPSGNSLISNSSMPQPTAITRLAERVLRASH